MLVLIILTVSGCMFLSRSDELPNSFVNWPLSAEFFIKDKYGQEASSFEIGEEINFEILIINRTDRDLTYQVTGAIHDFIVKQGQTEIWSQYYGIVFAQVVHDLTIYAHEEGVISTTWNCVDNKGNTVSPGEYEVIPKYSLLENSGLFSLRASKIITLK